METNQAKEEMSPLMKALRRRDAMITVNHEEIEEVPNSIDNMDDLEPPPSVIEDRFSTTDEIKTAANEAENQVPTTTLSVSPSGEKKGGRKPAYDVQKFIECFTETCNNGGSPADVAAKMEMNVDQVSQRAVQLRKKGHPLPQFKRGPKAKS
jgi:hypothetical protein